MTETMITLFTTELQKYGRSIASLEVLERRVHREASVGFSLLSSSVGLKALANIQ